ncbi:hypothetical protein ISF_04309 [Cordyceps fumosorosea ARSEF 2679]|uniref:Rhodopsin domain-containing protein n=1 Tax=Cordyceps fumosorosea (strain ARSEF 2679) TaxID=1081104 RepID=A0A167XF07_CORFA|nr:hypothetical protein ISF_04309 [Cordyceps fumosorosea ARSEF 2679]OAA64899.1 hypothetical protein ISF_04309 [Cordyceps fumosorosea ARSEF 2679]
MTANRGNELLGVNIAFFILASCTVLMRCYTRVFISKCFGLDDWLMALSCVFFLGYVICSNMGVHYGTGQHRDDLTPENYVTAKRFWFICYVFFGLTMMTAKLSFGWLLLRIVCVKEHKWIIYFTSFCVVVAGSAYFFVTVFQCQPIAHYWNDTISGHCIPIHIYVALAYLYSAVSVATDLIFALLPAFIIWHLQIRSDIRYVLIFLMGLGCVASIAVLVRVAYMHTFYDPDFLWATTDIAIWSTIEMGLALSAASCSTLRPLARTLGFNIGFTDYGSAGSEDAHHELRRASQPAANRRRSGLGAGVFNASGTSQDTLNASHTRDKSSSSQTDGNYVVSTSGGVNELSEADLERARDVSNPSRVEGAMDYSTSRTSESKNLSRHITAELGP